MKYINELRVYYADTDAYKVVWHGTYLRWLEAARVELSNKMGLDLNKMHDNGDLLPVIEMNIKYKVSAKLDDILVLETELIECGPTKLVFSQTVKNKATGVINLKAQVVCVAVNTEKGKMYRRLPEYIIAAFEESLK